MRVLLIQPNYHCGGAEIAGNWPPGWVAYIGGALKHAGIDNVRFVDAMTNDIPDDRLAELIRANAPDVVLTTAITPMIYQAQKTLEIARREAPACVTLLGGIHPTFMYAQVLSECPAVDYIVRARARRSPSSCCRPFGTARTSSAAARSAASPSSRRASWWRRPRGP